MKGLRKVSAHTSDGMRTPLYYSPSEDAVYTTDGDGRYLVTYLIRHNTPKEIEDTVEYLFKRM